MYGAEFFTITNKPSPSVSSSSSFNVDLKNVIKMDAEADEYRFSCLLILSAFIHFSIYSLTVFCVYSEFQDGSVVKVFEVEEALLIVFFQIFSMTFGAFALLSLMEKAWKGSYGYGEAFPTKIKSILAGIFSLVFLAVAALFAYQAMERFQFHGLYFLMDGITCLLFCILFIRRYHLIKEFVHDLLHANGIHWIPLTERNARDLYKLKECDSEMRAYVNSSRFGPFHRHAHAFRHSEFYQLQKWIAQIERFMYSHEPKESIVALVREMHARAHSLKIDHDDQERYRQLAALPFILLPVEPVKHGLMEYEDEV